MRILIACEESQEVCKAFRARGHEAYSCDILPCSGGHPEWHLQTNVLDILGTQYFDLMIGHPPCTFVSNAGCRWLYPKGKLNQERYKQGLKAKGFFMELLNSDVPRICIENPYPHKVFDFPKESQRVQPYEHGHKVQKKTLLWLKNLPKLKPTKIVEPEFMRDSKGVRHSKWFMEQGFNAGKKKSKTFTGIAKAMAEQWGTL